MTVGSPPSITATTEFVVPRSMPMILPMRGVWLLVRSGFGLGLVFGFGAVGRSLRRRPRGPAAGRGRAGGSRGGLVDDLALGPAGAGHVGDRLVLARIERRARGRVDRRSRPRSRAGLPACDRSPLTPSAQRPSAIARGRASMARSKSSATASTLRMRSSPRARGRAGAPRPSAA